MKAIKVLICVLLVGMLTAPVLANGFAVQRQVLRQRSSLFSRFSQRQVQRQVIVQQPLVQKQVIVQQQAYPIVQRQIVKQYVVQPQVVQQYVVPQLQLQQQYGCVGGQCGQVLQQQGCEIW